MLLFGNCIRFQISGMAAAGTTTGPDPCPASGISSMYQEKGTALRERIKQDWVIKAETRIVPCEYCPTTFTPYPDKLKIVRSALNDKHNNDLCREYKERFLADGYTNDDASRLKVCK